jgi:hypothetical protein
VLSPFFLPRHCMGPYERSNRDPELALIGLWEHVGRPWKRVHLHYLSVSLLSEGKRQFELVDS